MELDDPLHDAETAICAADMLTELQIAGIDPAALRREVRDRAGLCCEYCRIAEGDRAIDFAIDHVIAEKHGGKTILENLCLSCYECNTYKGSDFKFGRLGFWRCHRSTIQPASAAVD